MFSIETFDELTSTNDYLKEHYAQYKNKSVVRALTQSKGRGRFERVWESTSDLTFSILFKEAYPQEIIAPLAVVKALEDFGIDAMIKWPNDVLVNEKKLAGILIEKVYEGNITVCEIVGIGVNLSEVPITLKDKATYVLLDAKGLLAKILCAYDALMSENSQDVVALYQTKNYLKGRKILLNGVLWEVSNISKDGYLQVCNKDVVRYLKSEEVTLQQVY